MFNTQALALSSEGSKATQDKVYRALLHRCESVELRFRERMSFDNIETKFLLTNSDIYEKHVT